MALPTDEFRPSWSTHATIGYPKIAILPRLLSISGALVSRSQDKPYDLSIPGLSLQFLPLTWLWTFFNCQNLKIIYIKFSKKKNRQFSEAKEK